MKVIGALAGADSAMAEAISNILSFKSRIVIYDPTVIPIGIASGVPQKFHNVVKGRYEVV